MRTPGGSRCLGFMLLAFGITDPWCSKAAPAPPRTAPGNDAFAVVPWFVIQPENTYRAAPARAVDLSVRDKEADITVYENVKRYKRDLGRRFDLGSSLFNDAATPATNPVGDVGGACAGSAYRTVGGQPAKDLDLIGGLGAGRCD